LNNGMPLGLFVTGVNNLTKKGYDGSGVIIGVIDSGIDKTHPALRRCPNGALKVIKEVDYLGPEYPRDSSHGTAVAGLLAGYSPEGYKGIALNAQLISYRVADSAGNARVEDIAKAIRRAVEEGCHVINISMASSDPKSACILTPAIEFAHKRGRVIVANSGNKGPGAIEFPASFEEVISVASVDYDFAVGAVTPSASNDTTNSNVDFVAVGSNLVVCADLYRVTSAQEIDGASPYVLDSGSSYAAPIVAGFAAILVQKRFDKKLPIEANSIRVMLSGNSIDLNTLGHSAQTGIGFVTTYDTLLSIPNFVIPDTGAPGVLTA